MKECTKCGEVRSLDEFGPDKKNLDGKHFWCKSCMNKSTKERRKTKEGTVSLIYGSQRNSSRKRGHPMPDYSNLELRTWLFSQDLFHELFNKWVESGYDKWKKPSCDRIDNSEPYTLDNLQLMTWQENYENGNKGQRKGLLGTAIAHTPVLQYTLEDEFVAEYISQHEAKRVTGIDNSSISRCCSGGYKTAGGFIWKYKN